MRTTITAGLATLLLLAAAPVDADAQLRFGARVGASISDLSVDSDGFEPDFDNSTGFLLGAFLEVPLSGGWSFQPGATFVQKGAEETEDDVTLSIDLAYLELPLLLKYSFPTAGSVGVHAMAGPAIGIETSCEIGLDGSDFDASADCDAGDPDERIETKSVDIGATFGAGLEFGAGGATVLLDLFYNLGLTDISDDSDDSAKNRAFYLTAGLVFPIG